jgi:hypothetical protein
MESNTAAPINDSTVSVRPIWENLNNNLEEVQIIDSSAQPVDINKDNLDTPVIETPAPEVTPPAAETPKPEEVATPPKEAEKPVEDTTDKPLEFTLEDVKDAPETFPEDSWRKLSQDLLGTKIEKEDYAEFEKTFKDNFVPKAEAEKLRETIKNDYFSTLNPETAAALELKELGLPDHLLLDPTKEIDGFLALEDTELVRKEYESIKGMTPELVDMKIEEDIADGKIGNKAQLLRVTLNNNREQLLNTKSQLVEKYTAEKQQAIVRQKEQVTTQIKEALNTVSDFLGVNVNKEAKEAVISKLNKGLYDELLNNPANMAKLILYNEFGEKMAKLSKDKALAQGKAEATAKLSNIPIKTGQVGNKLDLNKLAETADKTSPFDFIPTF